MDTYPSESPTVMVAEQLPQDDAQQESFFYPCSVVKLALLVPATFGFYLIWWFWTQWRTESPSEGRWWALMKTIFSGFFFYTMARQVKEEAEHHGITCRYSPAVLTALVLADAVAARLLPPMGVLAAVVLMVLPVVPVQAAINRVRWETSRQLPRGWRRWEIAVGVVFGMLWALVILGLLLPATAGA